MTTTADPPQPDDAGAPETDPPAPPAGAEDPATSFTRQRATRWLEPHLLLRMSLRAVVSAILGEYNDKRELMGEIEADGFLDLSTPDGDLWIDYVADLGDGFAATYAVATLLSRPELEVAPQGGTTHSTRQGRLLVLGGDECYPAAHVDEYENRLVGPYRAALPRKDPDAPCLQAVPGNHDWYDGLTAFMRTFCQGRWIGGWRSRQARSYFATKLSAGWWLWGVDIQFDTYLDEAQLSYFRRIAEELRPGDAVLLCTGKPSWVAATDDDVEAYATLDFFEREVIHPRHARVRLALTGDRHHYSRYGASDGAQKITAGGGGAFLSATHHLPETIHVPPPRSRARSKSRSTTYQRCDVYPEAGDSRRLSRGILRLPFATPTFAALLGGVYALLTLAVGAALRDPAHGLVEDVHAMAAALRGADVGRLAGGLADSVAAFLLCAVVIGGAVAFTRDASRRRGRITGLVHGLLHLTLLIVVIRGATWLTAGMPGTWSLALVVPLVFAVGGILAAELVALYLLVVDRLFGINSNELFAGQAIPDRRNFLRLRLQPDGTLTVYPIGVRRVPRDWDLRPGWVPGDRERFAPVDGIVAPFLIEEPIPIPRTAPGTAA
ncbi:hypothetical protein GCM10027451_29910 [Geodermatophilus aquaeductus]|uniref:Calcineurin-like phosphoesterase n=1 Tax=Geodermatophilus aquaeductus TaxID=1564161 RepID=A0A521FVT1_9ACTN|nr:metallophosphoesterase [Geodermatophilus aquaeductus]SMO99800.1 hypothetical protein SAMN06273567_11924 [Geodermatophilus aquaeductus]